MMARSYEVTLRVDYIPKQAVIQDLELLQFALTKEGRFRQHGYSGTLAGSPKQIAPLRCVEATWQAKAAAAAEVQSLWG